jgi:hypothetical protein
MIYLWIFLLALVSAVLYRLGGWGGEGRTKFPWLPGWLFDTKARDLGCPLVALGGMFSLGIANAVPWWINVICFGAMFGALTTYWDFMFNDNDNFFMHGGMIALAYVPYAIVGGTSWLGAFTHVWVTAALCGIWSLIVGKDWVEEGGRGFIIIATLGFLLI